VSSEERLESIRKVVIEGLASATEHARREVAREKIGFLWIFSSATALLARPSRILCFAVDSEEPSKLTRFADSRLTQHHQPQRFGQLLIVEPRQRRSAAAE
jgi:hypothetical protein